VSWNIRIRARRSQETLTLTWLAFFNSGGMKRMDQKAY